MYMATLGFIGIGNMGAPMATRLINAGHDLVVFDTSAERAASLGAKVVGSTKEVADAAEIVLLSLPVPDAVRAVIAGPDGLVHGGKVKIIVDLSTTGRDTIVAMAEILAKRGITLVDAPVSGGPLGAEKGTLAVMVAGPAEARDVAKPFLELIGRVFIVGDAAGQGQVMKVLNNLLSATAMAATTEAMIVGAKAGLNARTMIDVLNASSGRNTATADKFPRSVLNRSFDFGFRAVLLHKDVKLCRTLAEGLGMPFGIGAAVEAAWAHAAAELGDEDFTRIVEVLERGTGVVVGGPAAAATAMPAAGK
jgi:3-hydroxyisobutyrate dehydrogenase-like beta-hydroxyacid dehydrogenase